MGKIEELIERLEGASCLTTNRYYKDGFNGGIRHALELAKEYKSSLPTQQDKVVVPELPRHIIDYLKWCERNNKTLLEVIGGARCHDADNAFWTEEERRKIAVAYATGDYTVEKEQLYYVVLPHLGYMTDNFDNPFVDYKEDAAKSTEKEIKKLDERYWAFTVPVEEDE